MLITGADLPGSGSLFRLQRREVMSRCSISNWAKTESRTELSLGWRLAVFAGRGWGAADLARQGFQQAPHALQLAGEFRLLLAGQAFLLAERFGLFGRAAAHGVQFAFQRRALLLPVGLLLPARARGCRQSAGRAPAVPGLRQVPSQGSRAATTGLRRSHTTRAGPAARARTSCLIAENSAAIWRKPSRISRSSAWSPWNR